MLYEIAFSLGIPLYQLMGEMPYDELLGWVCYFERRPVSWRDDLRTYHVLRAWGDKRKPEQVFPSLDPIFKPKTERGVIGSLKGSFVHKMMLTAKGGEKLKALGDL